MTMVWKVNKNKFEALLQNFHKNQLFTKAILCRHNLT